VEEVIVVGVLKNGIN